eukprot:TRINITY_DN18876_c0_g1_i4.p1 TRINITY_DN18876_c0_g1~~TRINITY_DN18876_c0_g1_i4.p1  ORF type:complete len:1460 (-),score=402.22 TRINITY_DN18876_c0_g1_i4:65-4444(-)
MTGASRWDPTLPYLSPCRGLAGGSQSGFHSQLRVPTGGDRSASPGAFSSSSESDGGGGDGGGLPNVEDIYDLRTNDLAALEARLSARMKDGVATPKEVRMHGLVRVELSERRGVEEIGLALVGGRLNLDLGLEAAAAAVSAPPPASAPVPAPMSKALAADASSILGVSAPTHLQQQQAALSSSAAAALAMAFSAPSPGYARSLRQPPPAAATAASTAQAVPSHWSGSPYPATGNHLELPSPSSSSRSTPLSSRSHSAKAGGSGSTMSSRGIGPGPDKAFKPTPVDFDFVIGSSSVKKVKPKPKKKPPAEKPPDKSAKATRPSPPSEESKGGGGAARRSQQAASNAKPPLAPKAAGKNKPAAPAPPGASGNATGSHSAAAATGGTAAAAGGASGRGARAKSMPAASGGKPGQKSALAAIDWRKQRDAEREGASGGSGREEAASKTEAAAAEASAQGAAASSASPAAALLGDAPAAAKPSPRQQSPAMDVAEEPAEELAARALHESAEDVCASPTAEEAAAKTQEEDSQPSLEPSAAESALGGQAAESPEPLRLDRHEADGDPDPPAREPAAAHLHEEADEEEAPVVGEAREEAAALVEPLPSSRPGSSAAGGSSAAARRHHPAYCGEAQDPEGTWQPPEPTLLSTPDLSTSAGDFHHEEEGGPRHSEDSELEAAPEDASDGAESDGATEQGHPVLRQGVVHAEGAPPRRPHSGGGGGYPGEDVVARPPSSARRRTSEIRQSPSRSPSSGGSAAEERRPSQSPRAGSADANRRPSSQARGGSSVEGRAAAVPAQQGAAAGGGKSRTGQRRPIAAAFAEAAAAGNVSSEQQPASKADRQRRPPLPKDTFKPAERREAQPAPRKEIDFVGLDPKLVEQGKITSYSEIFHSIASVFTWGVVPHAAGAKTESYLREAMQIFQQFCEVLGALECQFKTQLAPTDHATPSATHQALQAMDSRGAGLYGVFLKGIIDKLPSVVAPQPAPVVPRPVSAHHNVFNLRYYKVVQNRSEVYDIVTRVFHRKEGWEELPHGLGLANVWNLCWTWSKPKLDYSRLCVWQKVNHYPEAKHLTRKDFLKRCIERYTRTGGKIAQYFHIMPRTFVLPKEYCLFIDSFAKVAEENGEYIAMDPKDAANATASGAEGTSHAEAPQKPQAPQKPKVPNLWIMKPAGSSRGRGIQVVNDVGSVHYGELTIIQQYISDPHLIDGYKWDMRVYVTVTSFNPLEAFIYKDGFARFATVPYSTDNSEIQNLFVHLTNSSINRHNEDAMTQAIPGDAKSQERQRDALLGGTKIAFGTLRTRLKALGIDWADVWTKMVDVILKSLLMAEDHIPHQANSFELFGYDLILDTKHRVWLIEVNSSPSMGQEHLLDEQVKQPLISDTIDLVEPMEFDRRKLADVLHRRLHKAATGAVGGRQQLDVDLHAILNGKVPRKPGVMPERIGNYERIAPGDACDAIARQRGLLFNK